MAKATATNIVEVWNWLINKLEDGTLTANEQLVLVHVIAKFNRTMWTPTKINARLIAAAICKDTRTVTTALTKLVDAGVLTNEGGTYYLGHVKDNSANVDRASGATDDTARFGFKHTAGSGDTRGDTPAVHGDDTAGTDTDGTSGVSEVTATSRRRSVFK